MTIERVESAQVARDVAALARRIFGIVAALFVPREPPWAIAARDEEGGVTGGAILKKLGPKTAIVDFIFVDSAARGQGLGPRLLDRALEELEGADYPVQLALIRSDNTASWTMFARRGFARARLLPLLFGRSITVFAYVFFSLLALSGYDVWTRGVPGRTPRTGVALLVSLVLPALVALIIATVVINDLSAAIPIAALLVGTTLARIALSFPVARASGPVRFALPPGGSIISFLQGFTALWWPHPGFWVPREELWHESDYRAWSGRASLIGWAVTLAAYASTFVVSSPDYTELVRWLLTPLLVMQAIPVEPFSGFDGFRVAKWSVPAYLVGLAVTIALIAGPLLLERLA